MRKEDFATWLNGWIELNGGGMPTEEQWSMIKDHLKLVFTKVTPQLGQPPFPPRHSVEINDLVYRPHMPLNDLSKVPPVFPGLWPIGDNPAMMPTTYC